jgi:predicted nucleic acid-binding protein
MRPHGKAYLATMAVLDTNVLIRYLTQDNPDHAQRALALLQPLEDGSRTALLPEGVLVETVQVLSSSRLYNISREEIRTRLGTIVRLRGLRMANKRTYLRAFDLYVDYPRLSYVDALCVAYARRTTDATVVSFDQDYRNIPGIEWEEP